ncbi:ABC transporter permease [Phycicoccus endophyticus]|uniref:ABC transporter permease n=1 Tax=Phycicoccus endophyticus TaxID=1690220 RepID=A0A7G9R2Y3_9MICO|nr:ABC transporter permease [Phycicoccus endophyticus]NHI20249.1 ABC transporter permease [Phycicoccus endophyticus]QNN49958.1 ABC transporter permease [Phycicoccus endophyticus]GGL29281.1 sugar ABC transporter permease [Phycicoccus endophyticus]
MSTTTTSDRPASGIETKATHDSLADRVRAMQSVWILGVLVVIVAIFGVMQPSTFLTTGNLTNIAQNVSIWAVLAVGMTFVIITAGIDLSVGSVLVVSSVVAAKVMESMGDTGWGTALVGLVLSVVVGVFWGGLNGLLVAKAKVPPLIVTLGTLSVALGSAQILTGGLDIRSAPRVLQDSIGYGRLAGVPAITLIALVIVVIGGVILHRTRFGRYTYAIGSNEVSARRVGINVDRKLVEIYAFSGFLAGVAGILSLAQYGTTTIAGQSLTNLNVIAAVVIGGTSIFGGQGSMFGSMVGLFIPAVLQAGFVIIGVSPYWQTVAVGSILIAAVYVDQHRRAAAVRAG